MSNQVIKLSDNAAERIKHIMSKAEKSAVGVRVGVKSGGCAGMSYVMEYAREIKPNEEIIEESITDDENAIKEVESQENLSAVTDSLTDWSLPLLSL